MSLKKQFWTESHLAISVVHGGALGAYIGLEMASNKFIGNDFVKLAAILPVLSMFVINVDRVGHRMADNKIPSAILYSVMSFVFIGITYILARDIGANAFALSAICASWAYIVFFISLVDIKRGKMSSKKDGAE